MCRNYIKCTFLIFIVFVYISNVAVMAQVKLENSDLEDVFNDANFAYDNKEYDTAIEKYKELLNLGVKNDKVYFNLANSYLKENKIGYALANYNKALILSPRNPDIKANLVYAMEQSPVMYDDSGMRSVFSILAFWYFDLNLFELLTITIISNFVVCVIFGISFFYNNDIMKILKITSSVVLVVLVISTIIKIYNNYNVDHAFVVKNNSVVKSGYSNDYSDLFTLKEGTSLKIKASKNGWYKIQTIEDQKGWINSASIELVDIYH